METVYEILDETGACVCDGYSVAEVKTKAIEYFESEAHANGNYDSGSHECILHEPERNGSERNITISWYEEDGLDYDLSQAVA